MRVSIPGHDIAAGGSHRSSGELRQDLFPRSLTGYFSVSQNNDLICDIEDPFLMGNDKDGTVFDLFSQIREDLDQILEAPEVDARFRLVKDGK